MTDAHSREILKPQRIVVLSQPASDSEFRQQHHHLSDLTASSVFVKPWHSLSTWPEIATAALTWARQGSSNSALAIHISVDASSHVHKPLKRLTPESPNNSKPYRRLATKPEQEAQPRHTSCQEFSHDARVLGDLIGVARVHAHDHGVGGLDVAEGKLKALMHFPG